MRPALEDILMGQVASPSFPNDLRFRFPECLPIEKLLSFFNERVDAIYVDDELIAVPRTPWSE
jgi:hypothetical protein